MFFSHTVKGQPYNMPMLAELRTKGCTLMDYELIADEHGRRLIFFSRHAGIAGMIDALWTLGQRLRAQGLRTPFLQVEPAHRYASLEEARHAVRRTGERLVTEGLPPELSPLVVGFTGGGNVAQGALEIFDLLPHVELQPDALPDLVAKHGEPRNQLVKVHFGTEHLVERTTDGGFEKSEYYAQPERYRSVFAGHLRHLSLLVNSIYWEPRYPRLASRDELALLFSPLRERPRLIAVADITCDPDGSLACTVRETEPGNPVYVYDPITHDAPSGFEGPGLAVMAVGNLPTELPVEASNDFGAALLPMIPTLAHLDLRAPFARVDMPDILRRAVILWRGEFNPALDYLRSFL
jgi:alpha-aminoadipic semialdehyde synthase